MGRQQSVVQLTGSIGNLTFYKTKDGFLARQRGNGITKARMSSDPRFARTLENLSEFGRATKGAKLIRTALRDQLVKKADRFMTRRLSSAVMAIVKSDPLGRRGSRVAENGDLAQLIGFEFNENGKVSSSIYAPFTGTIDRVTGALAIEVPPFLANKMVVYPEGATHFRLKAGGISLDFADNSYLAASAESADIPAGGVVEDTVRMEAQLPPNLTTPLVLTLAIEYFQSVNGELYPLENGAYNGLVIVDVDQVPA